ncbi:hypothetical protein HCN08_30790 [Streptomyces sp. PRB2-1]|uniref:Helicase ATP-binding domain-containing protein n=1 Tax=Actinacidiphila epipremni TaxID=2053013 RepID=A0ABX1A1U8_9ACTN|nr:hypothetical protein [Actinacidiphila epipremni]
MGVKLSKSTGAVGAALALAGHYFPDRDEAGNVLARFRHAAFLLSGQLDKWAGWQDLPHEEKQRIGQVTASAPEELAGLGVFTSRARSLLDVAPGEPPAIPFTPADVVEHAEAAVPVVGGDPLDYVDRTLARLCRDHPRRRPVPPATPGIWLPRTQYSAGAGLIQGRTTIPLFDKAPPSAQSADLPEVHTVPYQAEVPVPTGELLELAGRIDERYLPEDRYVQAVLAGLFAQLHTTDSVAVRDLIQLLSGGLEILNAPTGTGKSVMVRVAASWFAINGRTLTIVLPTVEATLSAAWDIEQDLRHLGRPETCTPLMSPSRLHERAMKVAARIEGPLLEQPDKTAWKLDQLSYGCALSHHTQSTHPYPPGEEPCRPLIPLPPASGLASCPWMSTCGKYEQHRRACTASVVVTNHHNFMVGRFHLGILLDGRAVADLSVAEFAFRRSHALMIDEVDQFQSTALDLCSSELVLDSRRQPAVPLRELDEDKAKLPPEAVKALSPTISHARYLSEFLLASICQNLLHLRHYEGHGAARDRPGVNSTGWHLAGSRDRRLISLLFPDQGITSEQEIPGELFDTLNALRPAHPGTGEEPSPDDSQPVLEPHLVTVRDLLGDLLAPRGEDLLAQVQLDLHDALEDTVKDPHERSEAVELLIVRMWLAELDDTLALLRNKTAQLRSVGLRSARKLAQRLETGVAGSILPYGMLGKAIVGYRITGLDNPEKNAELTAQSISGDPHTYTAQLGSIVSLALAGTERPVMGLSATAYFPQAVREHVHAPVKWWMTDAAPDSIRARRHMITNSVTNKAIQISGLPQHLKREALITLGDRLYDTVIHKELARIARTDPDRAHAAVVVNSYEHCRHVALGIHSAGQYTGGLCVAVPADRRWRDKLPPLPPGIVELTPDEFEDFPNRGTILVVPMARIARGLNIVIGTKSAITPVYLCTRPLALLTDPAEMYASVNAAGIAALADHAGADPVDGLREARAAAWARLGMIMRSAPGFISTAHALQEEIVAGMVVDMIQLAGRARRGGTDMTLHLVDYAFHEDSWQSDLAGILRRMHRRWSPDVRRQMNAIYREALAAFLAYAGIDPDDDRL